jgi:hypothetical protein
VKEKKEKKKPPETEREQTIQHAIDAINNLKKIPDNAKTRTEALNMVKNWIKNNP